MNRSIIYDKYYYRGRHSNYIFWYQNLKYPIFWKRRSRILDKIAQGGRLLDIGCAFGYFLKLVEDKFEVYGIDISEYAVKIAKELLSRPDNIKVWDIEAGLPFTAAFKVITAFDIMEHITDPLKVLSILKEMLEDNGRLFLELPTGATLIDFDDSHKYRPCAEWFFLLNSAGFSIVEAKTYYTIGLRSVMIPSKKYSNYISVVAKKNKST